MPMVPPAPVRFSITTCWPIDRDIGSAVTRATKSSPPPAASGTMKRIGRFGQAGSAGWARAPSAAAMPAISAPLMMVRRSISRMLLLPRFFSQCRLVLGRHRLRRQLATPLQACHDQVQQTESELRVLEIEFLEPIVVDHCRVHVGLTAHRCHALAVGSKQPDLAEQGTLAERLPELDQFD